MREYFQWEFLLLAFIIPLVAGFASIVLLVLFSRVSGVKRRAFVRTVFVLDCAVTAVPITYLQMFGFPPHPYTSHVWIMAQHMGFGWYFTLACGLVASCLAAYLLQRERNVSADRFKQIRGASSTHAGATTLLPALYILLIVGVAATVYGFNQAWVLGEIVHFSSTSGYPLHVSGADYTGPIILVPITALLSLVLPAVSRIPGLKTNQAPWLAAQGLAVLGIALAFFWWVTFPRYDQMNRSYSFQYVGLEYGWFLSVGGLVLILGCLWFLDPTSSIRQPMTKEEQLDPGSRSV
jgi:hypothetical protein